MLNTAEGKNMIANFRIENFGVLKTQVAIDPQNEGYVRYHYGFSLNNHINHDYFGDRIIGRIFTTVNYTIDADDSDKEPQDEDWEDDHDEDPQGEEPQVADDHEPINYATMELEVVSIFSISADTPFDEFKRMLQLNGMATVIPMIRSTIFMLANLLGIRCDVLMPNISVREIPWNDE